MTDKLKSNKTKDNEDQKSKNKDDDKTESQSLENDLKEVQSQMDKLDALYKRAIADYQNLVRRSEEEKIQTIKYANQDLLLEMLDVLDDLTKSADHLKDEGLDKILIKLRNKLINQGLEIIDIEGEYFDPEVHEAIDIKKGPKDKIIEVYRQGYRLNGKVIRPALVCVGNGEN